MTFKFQPAVRGASQIMFGIAGPSRSGKTYSALRIARGMVGGDMSKVFFIDTESGRALQYVDVFGRFMHLGLEAPFSPERYQEAILAAEKAGAAVIIVDSQSHEHEGPGGILEMHEAELDRMAGQDWGKRERMKFSAWIKPKFQHNRYVNTVLQLRCHQIYCFRAKDKLALIKNEKGKQEPVSMGWQPICPDRFEYEMSGMVVLPEGARGIPDLSARATGLREPLDKMIRNGQALDEQLGERLAAWARGADPEKRQTPERDEAADTMREAEEAARGGAEAFTNWWNGPGRTKRRLVRDRLDDLRAIATRADQAAASDGDDPFGAERSSGIAQTNDAPVAADTWPLYNPDGERIAELADAGSWLDAYVALIGRHDGEALTALIKANALCLRDLEGELADRASMAVTEHRAALAKGAKPAGAML